MHYKNGREAKGGDPVVSIAPLGTGCGATPPLTGFLVNLMPGAESCNAQLATPGLQYFPTVTVGDCLHIDDIRAAAITGNIPVPVPTPTPEPEVIPPTPPPSAAN